MRVFFLLFFAAIAGILASLSPAKSYESPNKNEIHLAEVIDEIQPQPTTFEIAGQVLNTNQFEAKKEEIEAKYLTPTSTFTDEDAYQLIQVLNQELRKGKLKLNDVEKLDDVLQQI